MCKMCDRGEPLPADVCAHQCYECLHFKPLDVGKDFDPQVGGTDDEPGHCLKLNRTTYPRYHPTFHNGVTCYAAAIDFAR